MSKIIADNGRIINERVLAKYEQICNRYTGARHSDRVAAAERFLGRVLQLEQLGMLENLESNTSQSR
jgi:hypothetical protein